MLDMQQRRSTPQLYASSSAYASTLGPVISVPTFKAKEETTTKELDVASLTESAVRSLRNEDPFMYYSVFKPTGSHNCEDTDLVSMSQNLRKEGQISSLIISRQSCISVECDPLIAILQEMLEDNREASVRGRTANFCDCLDGDACSKCTFFS